MRLKSWIRKCLLPGWYNLLPGWYKIPEQYVVIRWSKPVLFKYVCKAICMWDRNPSTHWVGSAIRLPSDGTNIRFGIVRHRYLCIYEIDDGVFMIQLYYPSTSCIVDIINPKCWDKLEKFIKQV